MFGRSAAPEPDCGCTTTREGRTLTVDAGECPEDGRLADAPACRRTVVAAIGSADVDRIAVTVAGQTRTYEGQAVDRLSAAATFARRVADRDQRLAKLARREPMAAADEACCRAGIVAEIAAETGLADWPTERCSSLAFDPRVVPTVVASHLDVDPPAGAALRSARDLEGGRTVRIYERPEGRPLYHLEPPEYAFDRSRLETLEAAHDALISTAPDSPTDHREAVAQVAEGSTPVDRLAQVLWKHTAGYGVLEDLFADPRLSEVFVNAPAAENPIFVRVDGTEYPTNVTLGRRGTERLAAGLRTESGRAFSRAAPTVDASLSGIGEAASVRVAGVRAPASDGYAFALRAEGTGRWRLQRLVDNGTLSAAAAGLLSAAMARGGSLLIAGPRGAGKTTMTAALLWELPAESRLLAIEDTPELPVQALQSAGRDVQRLEAASRADAAVDPATALRTALRLGNGALAVGEVRGEEASVLYEAMRVGAASDTVIGTIHGDGYEGVKERVVSDLGVPASSFAATDLLVTLAPAASGKRVRSIEEVTADGSATLYAASGPDLVETPRLDRGNSQLVASLAGPDEAYADVRAAIRSRAATFERAPMDTSATEAVADG
jgi:type IV secretory pathway ATPase VirB11/archaellum biosynthesis ATPase